MTPGKPSKRHRSVVRGKNDLGTTHPLVASLWGSENVLPAHDYAAGSRYVAYWSCSFGHSWQQEIRSLAAQRRFLCLECSSVAVMSAEMAGEWHPNNPSIPARVYYRSSEKVWWKCSQGHEWFASPGRRVRDGSGCPGCKGTSFGRGVNDLLTTHPHLAAEWHDRNSTDASSVSYGSKTPVWWKCASGHEWVQSPNGRTNRVVERQRCARCISHGTSLLEQEVTVFFRKHKHSVNSREKIAGTEVDVFLVDQSKAIEVNGDYWHSDRFFRSRKWKTAENFHTYKRDTLRAVGVELGFLWESDWKGESGDELRAELLSWAEGGKIPSVLLCLRSRYDSHV